MIVVKDKFKRYFTPTEFPNIDFRILKEHPLVKKLKKLLKNKK